LYLLDLVFEADAEELLQNVGKTTGPKCVDVTVSLMSDGVLFTDIVKERRFFRTSLYLFTTSKVGVCLTTRWGTHELTSLSFTVICLEVFLHADSLLLINLYLLETKVLAFGVAFFPCAKLVTEDTSAQLFELETAFELLDTARVTCTEMFFGIDDKQETTRLLLADEEYGTPSK